MNPSEKHWFVLRDLKRRNSNSLAVFELQNAGLEVFTPMTQMIMSVGGRRQRRDVPVIQDLLFVHESKENLDPYVSRCRTLQYRYLLGKTKEEPMTVRDDEMENLSMPSITRHPRCIMDPVNFLILCMVRKSVLWEEYLMVTRVICYR